jgi:hypothetical protein
VVRKVTPEGTITSLPGKYDGNFASSGHPPFGLAAGPFGVAVDGGGNLYAAAANAIYRVTPNGIVSTVATGECGASVCFGQLFDVAIAVDESGNLYVAENAISKVDVSGAPSLTFAKTDVGEASASQDVAVVDIGNAPLHIRRISTARNFSLDGSDTSCSDRGQWLSPAASCALGIEFNPREGGSIGGSVVLTDNNLNERLATQTIELHGTAPTPVPAATTLGPQRSRVW